MVWLRVGILAAPGASKSFQIVITHFWGIQPTPRPKSNEEIWGDHLQNIYQTIGFGIRNPSELLKWFGQPLMELGPRCSASMVTFGGRKLQKINHIAAVQGPVQSKGCDFTKLATSRFCSKTWPTGLRLNMGQLWNKFPLRWLKRCSEKYFCPGDLCKDVQTLITGFLRQGCNSPRKTCSTMAL